MNEQNNGLTIATLGAGCFWCVEAIFQRVRGVVSVVSGYSGGRFKNPSYHEICAGTTGHAEVVQIIFDPAVLSFDELLKVFFSTHDPTTLNKQGADTGTQYRSIIFFHSDQQKVVAESTIKKLNSSGVYDRPIVTEVVPYSAFYPAEDYHQNYFNTNTEAPYCRLIIEPKVKKLMKDMNEKINLTP